MLLFGEAARAGTLSLELERFIETLKAESEGISDMDKLEIKPKFVDDYPHPQLPKLDAAVGPQVLQLMAGEFTGNPYADSYIRWHLQPYVDAYLNESFQQWLSTGKHELAEGTSKYLTDVYTSIPNDSDEPFRTEYIREPKEVYAKYWQVRNTTRVRVGVPPFERYVYGKEAMQYATAAKKKEIEEALKLMQQLEGQYTTRKDKEAIEFNDRQNAVNAMLKDYRDVALYALLQTGDDKSLLMIGDEISRLIGKKQRAGIDLMKYLYRGMYGGNLLLYDDKTLSSLRNKLIETARGSDKRMVYLIGDEAPDSWIQPKNFNFSELAFHMIQVLDSPSLMEQFRYSAAAPPIPPATRPSQTRVDANHLTIVQVQEAIDAAVTQLYAPSEDNHFILPHHLEETESKLYAMMRYYQNTPEYQLLINDVGNQALVTWAMLACGQSYQNPYLYSRLSYVLASDTSYTFDRSMRLQMLSNLSTERWQAWFNRDYKWLTDAYNADADAALAAEYGPSGPTESFSNANAQYGTLSLWAVERSGRPISDKVWQVVDNYWRAEQHEPDEAGRAGWSEGLIHGKHKVELDNVNRYALQVQAPMTAAGAAALSLTERYLYAEKLGDAGAAEKLPHLRRAIAYLDTNFNLDGKSPGVNWYFYLWNLQRVAHANGIRRLNGVDLFREVTADVLNRQRYDGTWEDDSYQADPSAEKGDIGRAERNRRYSRLVSTAYALLYLSDAVNSSVGISKVQFDGNWNNRPHDLWNFVEHASDEYESRTVWQVVDLKLPVAALRESPLLYLATDEDFELPADQLDRLREYLDAGGMLLLNPDRPSAQVTRSFNKLITALYPAAQLTDVPSDHPFYTLHTAASPGLSMKMVHNGVRPVIVQFMRDIGRDLQTHPKGDAPAFALLNNIYLYAVGLDAQRTRLESSILLRNDEEAKTSISVAQLKPAPEPGAIGQLAVYAANEHGLDVKGAVIEPTALKDQKLALLSIPAGYELPDADAEAIRNWLTTGGQLWLDAAGGTPGAIDAMTAALAKIEPQARPQPLAFDSPILTGEGVEGGHDNARVRYRYCLLAQMGASNSPRLQSVTVGGRDDAIILSAEDLVSGLAGLTQWNIFGYEPESARQLLANALLQAGK